MQGQIKYEEPPEYLDKIGNQVVDAAFAVHTRWGPGLLEHFYVRALKKELKKRGLEVEKEVYLPVKLDDEDVEDAYRIDLLVEKKVVIEIKSVDKILSVHHRQVRTYLKLTNNHLGYLINFNTELIKDGIDRVIMSTY